MNQRAKFPPGRGTTSAPTPTMEDEFDEGGYVNTGSAVPQPRRSMRDYLNWMFRKAWLIALLTTAGLILGIYVYKRSPQIYRAVATIEIERDERAARIDENDRELMLTGITKINTVAQKLTMPQHFVAIAENLSLHERPDIIPREFSFFSDGEEIPPGGLSPQDMGGMMVDWVSTQPIDGSNLLNVIVEHTSPEVAKLVANELLVAYQDNTDRSIKSESAGNMKIVREMIQKVEDEILKLGERLALYNGCLSQRERIEQVEEKIIDLSKRYGEKWPDMIEARTKLSTLEDRFEEELLQVILLSEDEKKYWEALPKEVDRVTNVETRANLLASELKNKERSRDDFMGKIDSAVVGQSVIREFSVQRAAVLPAMPVAPSRLGTIGKLTFAGFGLGVGIVLLLGFLDPSARTISDLEGLFDLPILGAIPRAKDAPTKPTGGHSRPDVTIFSDNSQTAEAVRNLRAGLSFLGDKSERRTFVLTSSLPSEGKSWTSANLAASFAAQGDRTLLIDMDLRKPVLHRAFGLERNPGLTDYLTQRIPLKDVFYRTEHDNLFFIPAGTHAPNPSELLVPTNLEHLLSKIPEKIDRIIIDTAPVLAVRDALAPAKLVDSVVVVFKMAKTPVRALDRLIKILDENGTLPVGIVANELPMVGKKGYGYGGDYYYGYYGSGTYYGEEKHRPKGQS